MNRGEPLAYLGGRLLPQSEATLPLYDAGFVMGATVTDLCRTFRHELYRWQDHLARFRQSCQATEINPPLDSHDITAQAQELVRHNVALLREDQELALVIFATPGPVGYYQGEAGGAGDGPATFGIHTFPLPFARYRSLVERGAGLVVPNVRHLPATSIDPRIKMRSRMHWWLADRQARRLEPGAAALLLDADNHVTETAGANLLVVRGGKILSPPKGSILEGISRQVVVELCGKLGISFGEEPLSVHDVETAEEALLASTPYCLVGVSRCNGKPMPFPGKVLARLLEAWSADVGLDIQAQILARTPSTGETVG
jgi:branched-subunit amino acid aminotransferase/4-amino-4-deoxychorismate lyase